MLAKKFINSSNYSKKNNKSKNRKVKTPKQIERHLKGVANHKRIAILFLVAENPKLSLEEISERLKCNLSTISEHTRRLVQAGLIRKNYKGRQVLHELSPYGKIIYKFLKTFQHSQ